MTELAYDSSRDGDDIPYYPEGYVSRKDGVYLTTARDKSEEKISGPIVVWAYTKDVATGAYGIVLRWTDLDGDSRQEAFPKDWLHEQGGLLAKALVSRGLELVPGRERALLKYLGSFDSHNVGRIQSTAQLGWVEGKNSELVFVLPGETIRRDEDRPVVFQPEAHSPTASTIKQSRTLEQWNSAVARPCIGNPILAFCLAVPFAGPLLKFAGLESGGFHIFGQSSRGKTTAAQVSASVWGCGADPADAPSQAFVQRWNATSNALEGLAAAHNDGCLVLDEIHTCNAKDFGAIIYNLMGGKGKNAMTRDRQLRPTRTWHMLVISTGEISTREKIEEQQKRIHAGQTLRMVDIPIDDTVIVDTHADTPQNFVKALKRACSESYGSSGPAFVRALVERYEDTRALSEVVREDMDHIRKVLDFEGQTPEQERAADRFALVAVAGKLAVTLDILDVPEDVFVDAACELYRAWCCSDLNVPEGVRGAKKLQGFLLRHGSRFDDVKLTSSDTNTRDLLGYIYAPRGVMTEFYILPDGLAEATDGFHRDAVAQTLKDCGLLQTNECGRFQTKKQVDGKRIRVYAIDATILEHDFIATPGADGARGATN